MLNNCSPATYANMNERLITGIERLQSWDIPVNPSSRLRGYVRLLERSSEGDIPSSLKALCNLAFQVMEIDEILDILDQESDAPDEQALKRLHELPKGALVRNTSGNNLGRNFQFELYVRALLLRAGLPCRLDEPDLVVDEYDDARAIYLEAKRPQNANSFTKNFKKALNQLNPKAPGIILMSLEHVLFGDNNVVQLEEKDDFESGLRLVENHTQAFLESKKSDVISLIRKKPRASALFVLVKVPVLLGINRFFQSAHHVKLIKFTDNENVDRFDQALERVWGVSTYEDIE